MQLGYLLLPEIASSLILKAVWPASKRIRNIVLPFFKATEDRRVTLSETVLHLQQILTVGKVPLDNKFQARERESERERERERGRERERIEAPVIIEGIKLPRRYGNPLSSSSDEEQQDRHVAEQENSPRMVVPSMSRFGQGRGRIIRGSSVRERGRDCCPCNKCTCQCHQNSSTSRNISSSCEVAQKRSLEKSKTLFLERHFPMNEDKMQLLTDGVSIKNVNKWFINYRYCMFSVLKKRATKKIRSNTTEEEITRMIPKAT